MQCIKFLRPSNKKMSPDDFDCHYVLFHNIQYKNLWLSIYSAPTTLYPIAIFTLYPIFRVQVFKNWKLGNVSSWRLQLITTYQGEPYRQQVAPNVVLVQGFEYYSILCQGPLNWYLERQGGSAIGSLYVSVNRPWGSGYALLWEIERSTFMFVPCSIIICENTC